MMKDINIGRPVGNGIGIIFILLLIVGGGAMYEAQSLNAEIDTLVKDRIPTAELARKILEEINVVDRSLLAISSDSDTARHDAELKKISDSRHTIEFIQKSLYQANTSEKGQAILSKIDAIQTVYFKQATDCIELVKDGNAGRAKELLLMDMRNSRRRFVETVGELVGLKNVQDGTQVNKTPGYRG